MQQTFDHPPTKSNLETTQGIGLLDDMGRAAAGDYDEAYDDDEGPYEVDEPQPPPRRSKGGHNPTPRYVAKDDDGSDEEEHYEKQVVVHKGKKTSKFSGKEVARRRKEESSEDPDSDAAPARKGKKSKSSGKEVARRHKDESSEASDSDEAARKARRKTKAKTKERRKEKIEITAWEACPPDEIDDDFLFLMLDVLQLSTQVLGKACDKGKVERHTQTGEYNIDALLDGGDVSIKSKNNWKNKVKELKANAKKSKILYCSAVTDGGDLGGPSMIRGYGPSGYGPSGYGAPVVFSDPTLGHLRYNYHCRDCALGGGPCGLSPY
ncbi:MAG: hypothetical protein Q9218_003041 [Villophora microphyllina]